MSANPFFSILVPTYNHAKYVGAALDSLLAQTERDWEAIVVNDGSTDNTAEVLNAYAQRDPRIRVVHKPNGGTGSALNRALAEARGDWICWLSSDDFFDPNKLAIHREWIRRDPTCRFHFTYFRLFNQAAGTTVDHQLWGPLPEREFQVLGLFYRNYISGISICIHRQSWQNVGRFNERLRYAQDYDMWLRLLARFPATFIPEWTCINRHHSGQYSEIFPQACYYDTAAAGVQFLNDHRFEQMFPLLDLADPAIALGAIERSLDQAADASAFLYWYGAHPCLLARTLEWAWDRNLGPEVHTQRAPVRRLAGQLVHDYARRLRGTTLGWYWHVAAAALKLPNADFTYAPMQPVDVGLGLLHEQRSQGKTEFADLQRYFKMQYHRDLPPAPPKLARRTVVVAHSSPAGARQSDLTQQLHAAGCLVANVAIGADRFTHDAGIPQLAAKTREAALQAVHELLPADAVICDQLPDAATAFLCRQTHVLEKSGVNAASIFERILDAIPDVKPRPRTLHVSTPGPRRKVVFIGRSPWGGGAERVTYDLMHALDPQKYELHFVHLFCSAAPSASYDPSIRTHDLEACLSQPPFASDRPSIALWRRLLRRAGRYFTQIGATFRSAARPHEIARHLDPLLASIEQAWPHVLALRNVLKSIGPDSVLIPVMEEATVCTWLARTFAHQPYCVSLHSTESKNLPLMYPNPARAQIERFLFSCACRDASAITIPSHGCKRDLIDTFKVPESHIEVVPNPIDLRAALLNSTANPEIPLPDLKDKTLFIHLARLSLEKNHQLLLDACGVLKQQHQNFVVVCLGDGPLRPMLKQRIHEMKLHDQVLLLGTVRNPFAYLSRAKGLVLTSQFESFALVLVEALACGAVPIAVDCPYGPREVLENGTYGMLVPPNSPTRLADAMSHVMKNRSYQETYTSFGQARAQQFTLEKIVPTWERIIDNLSMASSKPLQSRMQAA